MRYKERITRKATPAILGSIAFLLLPLWGCSSQQPPRTAGQGASAPAVAEPPLLPAAQPQELGAKKGSETGTACVKSDAPDCPADDRGKCSSHTTSGCGHDVCTAAKNQARADLRKLVPAACHKYIQSTQTCTASGCK